MQYMHIFKATMDHQQSEKAEKQVPNTTSCEAKPIEII